MPTIDLGSPPAPPADLLDGLPRRVALTLPELRYVARRAGDAPLPFDVAEAAPDTGRLSGRLGQSRGSQEDEAYAAALAALHEPAQSLNRRGLMVGGPEDGVLDPGLVGAVGLLATPTVALDLDVVAGGVQAKAWHRQSGGAAAALATADGLVFELAWFAVSAWPGELARVAVLPEDLDVAESGVEDVDLPFELLDAAMEAARSSRPDLIPVLVSQHSGATRDLAGAPLRDTEVVALLTSLSGEARGRLRAMVADVSATTTSIVGVVSWTLLADGWRALRPHQDGDQLRVEVRRVAADALGSDLAPVIAEVSA